MWRSTSITISNLKKSFYEPLKNVLNCIGWDSKKQYHFYHSFNMDFLSQVIKDSKNEFASLASDGIAAGDVETFVDTGKLYL